MKTSKKKQTNKQSTLRFRRGSSHVLVVFVASADYFAKETISKDSSIRNENCGVHFVDEESVIYMQTCRGFEEENIPFDRIDSSPVAGLRQKMSR